MKKILLSLLVVFSATSYATENVLLAAGEDRANLILDVSTDGGQTWIFNSDIYNTYTRPAIKGKSCFGSGVNGICVIALNPVPYSPVVNGTPGFLVSGNGGSTWETPRVNGLPPYTDILTYNTSCFAGDSDDPRCVISGSYNFPDRDNWDSYFIALSKDHGKQWNVSPIKGFSSDTSIYMITSNISCSGKGSKAVCATSANTGEGYVLSSVDGGETWKAINLGYGRFNVESKSSCTGAGSAAVCVITDYRSFEVSHDGVQSWSLVEAPIISDATSEDLSRVSCTGEGANALCVAIGSYEKGYGTQEMPLLFVSQDAGNTWIDKSALVDSSSKLNSVSCATEGSNNVCAIVGNADKSPLVLVSNDNGNTWSRKNISNAALLGNLNAVNCKSDDKAVTCVGEGSVTSQAKEVEPLLVVGKDKGSHWFLPTVQGMPTSVHGWLGRE